MKCLVIGLIIGIVSFIPGISGGTIFYLTGELENLNLYLKNIKKYYSKIILILLGTISGILIFAPILEYAFLKYPNITKLFFAYLVLFSLPNFFKKIKVKINFFYFLLAFIFLLILKGNIKDTPIIYENIKITLPFLLLFSLWGAIDGFITIIPGISGSMIMMILGPYYIYKSISAKALSKPLYLLALLFYFLGDLLGIIIGSFFTHKIINKYPIISNSFILGFIIASIFIMVPYWEIWTLEGLITLLISYLIISLINLKT